jgi:hypothetical protein
LFFAQPITLLHPHSTTLFKGFVSHRLATAAANIRAGYDDTNPFEDTSVQQEHMMAAAVLGRASGTEALLMLASGIERVGKIAIQSAPVGDADVSIEGACAMEELYWLLEFTGYLLADAAEGERASVPRQLNCISKHFASSGRKFIYPLILFLMLSFCSLPCAQAPKKTRW